METNIQSRILLEMEKLEKYRKEKFKYGESLVSDFYFHEQDDHIFYTYIFGQQDSIHHGAIYRLKISLPENYPLSKPTIKFKSPYPYHPNISTSGSICLNKYKKWNGTNFFICDILDYIDYLLYNPNPNSCLNWEAGKIYKEEYNTYEQLSK